MQKKSPYYKYFIRETKNAPAEKYKQLQRNPADIGFDKEKLSSFDGTIVCAANESAPNIMCHFVRRTETGCELRTRFWLGYCVRDSHPVKCKMPPARMIPLSMARGLLAHNLKEFTNLAAILPEVYEEFKDQF